MDVACIYLFGTLRIQLLGPPRPIHAYCWTHVGTLPFQILAKFDWREVVIKEQVMSSFQKSVCHLHDDMMPQPMRHRGPRHVPRRCQTPACCLTWGLLHTTPWCPKGLASVLKKKTYNNLKNLQNKMSIETYTYLLQVLLKSYWNKFCICCLI